MEVPNENQNKHFKCNDIILLREAEYCKYLQTIWSTENILFTCFVFLVSMYQPCAKDIEFPSALGGHILFLNYILLKGYHPDLKKKDFAWFNNENVSVIQMIMYTLIHRFVPAKSCALNIEGIFYSNKPLWDYLLLYYSVIFLVAAGRNLLGFLLF